MNSLQSTDYQTRLRQLEQQKRDAERVKQAHLDALNAPDAAVAEAQAQIDLLHRQEQQRQLDTLVQANNRAADAVLASHKTLIEALERGDVWSIPELRQAGAAAWQEHQQRTDAALRAMFGAVPTASQYQMAIQQAHLRQAYGVGFALLEWIAKAPNEVNKQVRRGLTFAVMGELYDARPGYDAAAEFRRQSKPAMIVDTVPARR